MPTFIDESGDVGIKASSARHFRLVAVCFENEDLVNPCVEAIGKLIRDRGLPSSFEFHFSKNNQHQKAAFFNTLANFQFSFVASHFDKDRGDRTLLTQDTVRRETMSALTGHLVNHYRDWESRKPGSIGLNERIFHDECQDPNFKKAIKLSFRHFTCAMGGGGKLIRSIKQGNSKSEFRIQIADMVCGAVGRHLSGDSSLYNIIQSKPHSIIVLPERGEGEWSEDHSPSCALPRF